ncbi:MAG TPA: JAB domain-containing protein [Candidatus Choladocola avistercoris]|nr:JAB domain-containing protein [Candidatus Choladocola avistercoris]
MMNELNVVNIRLVNEPSLYSEKELKSPEAVLELMASEMASYDREVLCVLNLKANGQVINMNIVSVGTVNASLVNPREIFKSSILSNACGIILVHNHPSGRMSPSKEDVNVTKRLRMAGAILGIELLDHVIIGGTSGKMYSFMSSRKDLFAEKKFECVR